MKINVTVEVEDIAVLRVGLPLLDLLNMYVPCGTLSHFDHDSVSKALYEIIEIGSEQFADWANEMDENQPRAAVYLAISEALVKASLELLDIDNLRQTGHYQNKPALPT